MIELITETIAGDIYKLDMDQQTAITFTKTFLEITDIEKRKGDFSRQFTLPKSDRNDVFFGNIGDPSSVGAIWNTQFPAPVWVIQDTQLLLVGTLRLESVDRFNSRYAVSVSGTIYNLKTKIGENLMSDLDMAAWSFTFLDIDSTWDQTYAGGHMIFTVHDTAQGYGQYVKEGDPAVLTLQDIKSASTPLRLYETLPAFRVNELLRKIFLAQGFNIDGSWFSEPEAEEIYCLVDTKLSLLVPDVSSLFCNLTESITLASTVPAVFPFTAAPSSAIWDDVLHEYNVPANGNYFWNIFVDPTQGTPTARDAAVQFQVNGVDYGAPFTWTWSGQLNEVNIQIPASEGDTIRVMYYMVTTPNTPGSVEPGDARLEMTYFEPTGSVINPAAYWTGHRQIDFLRSITQIFNLIIWTQDTNRVRIDTWDYYVATLGTRKDWRAKLDVSKEPVIKPINGVLRNPINLSLRAGEDILNTEYQRISGRQYGSYREDTLLPFTQAAAGELEKFAPAPTQEIQSINIGAQFPEFIAAKLFDDIDNISYKPPGLQLFYYNGLRSVDPYYVQHEAGGGTTLKTDYPYFSNFRLYAASSWLVDVDTLDLNFTWWTPAATGIVTNPSEQGLYNRYFREMLRERYDTANKIIECFFVLDATDISNFLFGDMIIIELNGTPVGLRIIEIVDYSPTLKQSTKVKAMLTFLE